MWKGVKQLECGAEVGPEKPRDSRQEMWAGSYYRCADALDLPLPSLSVYPQHSYQID